ncbi:MAG: hypothetical protein HYX40_06395 [Sphingobacteriales bacterium]|nr:hypothetical protein [Sphingobacteriales bacterium]
MKPSRIHNLDNLEKEIYRLKLHSKKLEDKMDDNFNYLKENYSRMARNSFFGKKEGVKDTLGAGISGAFFRNEKLQQAIDKIVTHLVEKATDGLDTLLDKLFKRE